MKLKSRFSLCTSAVTTDDIPSPPTTTTTTPTTSPYNNTSLNSHLSLQTLPSVPSLQSLSLLDFPATITSTLITTLYLPSSVTSLSFSSPFLYISSSHLIHVYDITSLTLLETFNSHSPSSGAVKSLSFCNGKILSAHQDGKIKVWKLTENNKQRHHKRHELVSTLPTLTDRLRRFPVPKNHVQVRRHKTRLWVEHHDAVSSLAVSNGKIYSVSWDKTLKVWDPKRLTCNESVTAHDDAINAVIVSLDGVVYTGSAEGRIRVWVKPDGSSRHTMVATLEKHKSAVNALVLNSDGTILFSGACDRSILVWEREDSAKYMVVSGALRGHGGAILCLINVGDFLISGSGDRTVRIWRRGLEGSFCCLSVLCGHLKPVKSLVANIEEGGDEIKVFSGGLDGELKVWSLKINYSNHVL